MFSELRDVQDAFADPLATFVRESGVQVAVLVNRSGHVLGQHGFGRIVDLVGVASLAAGINATSRELARRLGEERFEHLHHSGLTQQLFLGYLETLAGQLILVAVFDERSSIGLVRLFYSQFVESIKTLPGLAPSDVTASAEDFERELEASLDRFFGDLTG